MPGSTERSKTIEEELRDPTGPSLERITRNRDGSDAPWGRRMLPPASEYLPPMSLTPKRYLVTGGAGFLGSHLVDALMKQGQHVVAMDNLSTGDPMNLAQWMENPNFEFIHHTDTLYRHDVTLPYNVKVDYIYHLACPGSLPKFQRDPVQTLKTCFRGTQNMLDMAKRYDARILIASTSGKSSVRLTRSTITDLLFLSPSEVYGDPEVHPQPENYNGSVPSYGPRACYDEGKRVSEALAYAYQESERVDVRIARIFDTYGERMALDDGRVVSNFIIAALTNQDLVITGDGTATRSFCHVSDLVRGLMRLMVGDYTGPVNLGTPEEYSIKELADMILDIVHTEDKGLFRTNIVYLPAPMHDPRRRCPDISLAYRLMWWSPSVTVREGLERTINHFRTHINSMQAMDLDLMIHSANVVAALHDEAADAGDEGVVLAAPAPESADSSDVELD